MGIFRSLFGRPDPVVALALDPDSGPKFVVDADSVPPEVFGLTSYADPVSPAPRVDRRSAMQVAAVKRSRDLIATAIGGLPLQTFRTMNGDTVAVTTALLEQPEPDVPRSVTMTNTAEDMFFEKYAWWRVIERDAYGWPQKVRRLNPRSVDTSRGDQKVWYRKDGTTQGESWEWIPDADLIRFESPNDAFLVAGARAVRNALQLDATATQYAAEPQAREYFTPAEDADPVSDDDIRKIVSDWNNARRNNGATGYVPAALKLNAGNLISPRDLQLADARQHAVLEIARSAGVDPEELGVSTTSRTYANQFDRRKAFLDFTLGGYLLAIEGRLSMGDVTPRGQYVKFNLDAFLRSDTAARYAAYAVALSNKILTLPEVRDLEDLPPLAPEEETVNDQTDNVVPMRPPAATAGGGVRLSADAGLTMNVDADQRFEVDLDKRTISGLAVPYGAQGFHEGIAYEFGKGTIKIPADPSRVKMFIQHDPNRAVGYATKLEDTDDGLYVSFKIAATPAGDEALLMADSKVWDGMSAGFLPGSKFRATKNGVQFAVEAPVREVSLCPSPAFEDARVSAVALMADNEGNLTMTETTVTPAATAPEATAVADQVAAELAKYGLKPGQELTFSAVTKAIEDGFANLQAAAAGPTAVPAVPGSSTAQVKEELPYRFNASTRGQYGFVEDLRDMQHGNAPAKQRLETFLEEVWKGPEFAVTKANSAAFNPVQNRPEMYVPQLDYQRPLWDSVSTGTIDNITAFTIPKFSSASGLVGTHTEGDEPTPGAFAATVQTVTPNAISGKIEINREVLDQGGSPQTDTIVWQEMQRAYWEGIETNIATMLNALSAATLYTGAEINFGGAVDSALDDEFTDLFTGLQFVRGGNRYTSMVADGQLYAGITGAKDSTGRSLYPLLGPTNADGTVEPVLRAANVKGQVVRPAWALGNAVDSNSYLFVPSSVWAWASAPKRFTFEYQVKSVDMAIWGYAASAVLRNTDVARIDYTTADA